MAIEIAVGWQQVATIAITQTVSTATTFYVMKGLGMFHSKEKSDAKGRQKNGKAAEKVAEEDREAQTEVHRFRCDGCREADRRPLLDRGDRGGAERDQDRPTSW